MSLNLPDDPVLREAQRSAGRKLGLLVDAAVYLVVKAMLVEGGRR